jgi:hypothetical protein
MVEMRNVYKMLAGKPEGKRPLENLEKPSESVGTN